MKEKGSFCMKNIVRKITMALLSAIVMVTMLPFYTQAAEWYNVPLQLIGPYSDEGKLYVGFLLSHEDSAPTASYYFKLSCVEDSTEQYYGTSIGTGPYAEYNQFPTTGSSIYIAYENDPAEPSVPGGASMAQVTFTTDIIEIGKHYSVQLVSSTDGGLNYTPIGAPSETIEVVNTQVTPPTPPTQTPAQTTEVPKPVVPKHPYWWECYNEIKELGKSSEPETLVYEEGTALPIEIMEALQECPNVTLIFKCCYNDTDYEFTISGEEAIVISDIPWYGPLWLNQYYSEEALSTTAMGED